MRKGFDSLSGIVTISMHYSTTLYMANARRMFFDALENDAARVEYALKQIGNLSPIERKASKKHWVKQM